MSEAEQDTVLKDYSEGRRGTRETIRALGLRDYGDLVVALANAGFALPRPPHTPALIAHREAARNLLLPLLKRGH